MKLQIEYNGKTKEVSKKAYKCNLRGLESTKEAYKLYIALYHMYFLILQNSVQSVQKYIKAIISTIINNLQVSKQVSKRCPRCPNRYAVCTLCTVLDSLTGHFCTGALS